MTEKRHRSQQRRQHRRAVGGSRPKAQPAQSGSPPGRPSGNPVADRELAKLMKDIAAMTAAEAHHPATGLEAEEWASSIIGTWPVWRLLDRDLVELFHPAYVAALEELRSVRALAVLRALSGVGSPRHARRARAAAGRLAGLGLREPAWASEIGRARPVAALLMHEEVFDDGVNVMIEFAGPDPRAETHTLGLYIDHNLGGLVKDAFLAGPLRQVRQTLRRHAPADAGLSVRELALGEARARVEDALEMLDRTLDPPVSDDVRSLRALIDARLAALPARTSMPVDFEEVEPAAREQLLSDFLGSPDGSRWRGDEDAEEVVATAIDFACDYNHGGPLRWSPVVVEIFMTSWLARKFASEPQFYQRLPEVLPDWVRFAGRRRGVPPAPLEEAVGAVALFRDEMLQATGDPRAWGPAKAFAVAALQAGVDLSNPRAVEEFMARYNDGLAA